jgi:hypothetical protein
MENTIVIKQPRINTLISLLTFWYYFFPKTIDCSKLANDQERMDAMFEYLHGRAKLVGLDWREHYQTFRYFSNISHELRYNDYYTLTSKELKRLYKVTEIFELNLIYSITRVEYFKTHPKTI